MSDEASGDRHAIVLAGGRGLRLRPHTAHRPKALVSLGGQSILEIILRQLAAAGFGRASLCISHMGEMIRDHLGDGRWLGLEVDYAVDLRPLGTAGPLRLVADWSGPALVMNCDILTTMDFAHVHADHVRSGCALTVVANRRELPIESGVLDIVGGRIRRVWEKPLVELSVAAGVYVADPCVRAHLREGVHCDMPELIAALIANGSAVNGYRWRKEWHDIGTIADFEAARRALAERPQAYLPARGAQPAPWPARRRPAGGVEPADRRARLAVRESRRGGQGARRGLTGSRRGSGTV